MKKIEKSIELAGRKLTLATGHIAEQATSAVMATYGETVVMVTVVAADITEDRGYFPLSVEYQKRLYAGGRIKGSRWVKREGRPTDDEILTARLIDRSIRPLFPEGYMKDVQVIITVMSIDMENSPDMLAAMATSAALAASTIPWNGPVGTIRFGMKDGKTINTPLESELIESELDLVVSTTDKAIVMIEAGAKEVPEDKMAKVVEEAYKEGKKIVKFIDTFTKAVGRKKDEFEYPEIDKAVFKKVSDEALEKIVDLAAKMATKEVGYAEYDALKYEVVGGFESEDLESAKRAFGKLFEDEIRSKILSGKRVDGRKTDELRELSASVSILPRTHGSGLFQRGQTQALTVATLASTQLEQLIETAEGEHSKGYIHHYSMPPFSVGETGRIGSPKRREIGHGVLAEKAILPVLPSKDEFPYTVRVVTEILSSNGSTSMASVCGSTLSLMDAGVPIKSPVAGIAMGVVIESAKEYKVLTDIVGIEDGAGDMDFKVAGTKEGITALQLDVKTLMLTPKILVDAFAQAKKARLEILEVMQKAIKEPRGSVSIYAPKIKIVKIDPEKIGELIGPGGKTIKKIIAETGAEVNVDDDGTVSISAVEEDSMNSAMEQVEGITKVVQPGELYEGTVVRIENFGAFVEILPNKQGLVHISDMSTDFVKDTADVVDMGQTVQVKVKEVDDLGRINLTMVLDDSGPKKDRDGGRDGGSDRGKSGYQGRNNRGGGRRYDGGSRNSNKDRNNNRDNRRGGSGRRDTRGGYSGGQKKSGPHFPASRLMDTSSKKFSR